MDYQTYMELGYKIKEELRKDINGSIRFLIFENDDAMTIDIEYKDFKFRKILVGVSEKIIYAGRPIEDVCNEIKAEYKTSILNMYFKSEFKKKREEEWKNVLSV